MTRFHVDNIAEPIWGVQVGPGVLNTHPPSKCRGQYCVVHNPSDHHMRDWPLNWRADRYLMERMCAHGCGHPDPDDVAFQRSHPVLKGRAPGSHGCDGCCWAPEPAEMDCE